jgi:hypothetical protein
LWQHRREQHVRKAYVRLRSLTCFKDRRGKGEGRRGEGRDVSTERRRGQDARNVSKENETKETARKRNG